LSLTHRLTGAVIAKGIDKEKIVTLGRQGLTADERRFVEFNDSGEI